MNVERDFRLMVTVPGENPTREDFLEAVATRLRELTFLPPGEVDEEFVVVAKRECE